ncbi:MAG: DsrE family protein [Bacteroidota bacterium]
MSLLADAVICGLVNQKTPDGYYNIGRMLKMFIRKNGQVKTCGTCMDVRGMAGLVLEESISRSNMTEFAQLRFY